MKVGESEFEAEGPADVVQAQLAAWKELLSTAPKQEPGKPTSLTPAGELPHLSLEKILKVDGRVVSLTARSETIDDAVLVLLLGQKESRNNQSVTGAELMEGLTQSGYSLPRIDKVMDKLSDEGSVITVGVNRGRRYRLSNTGLSKALMVAKEVIATVP
jgi:hypothetical protein